MKLAANIFKAYDIRGIYGKELTLDAIGLIAKSISNLYPNDNDTIVIGRDGRNSSSEISKALIDSFLKNGKNVIDIGEVPTPLLYFAVNHLSLNSGIIITGSHNPKEYNGLKMIMDGHTLSGGEITRIYDDIIDGAFSNLNLLKTSYKNLNISDEYIKQVNRNISIKKKLKIAVDAGNGVAGPIAVEIYRKLGLELIELYCNVDGDFPNHHPNPSDPKNLIDLINEVKKSKCDLGIAFDGDGDRCLILDNKGNIVWPDRQMMIFSKDILSQNQNAKVIYDVKSSSFLANVIKNSGGEPIMCRTGHSYIKKMMRETNAILAGEMSGHVFFNDKWYGFDDGIYCGARMIEIVSNQSIESSEIFADLPNSFSTPEINIPVDKDGIQHDFMEKFKSSAIFEDAEISTIDGLRVDYDDGWGLLRASNTTSCLVMRFEAESEERLLEIKNSFISQIRKIDSRLEIPNE
tara:strand:+ start:1037 stop:2422 length:1386 start_codon:yes stop_codon:yes gene_type:complete